ncbi:hypothetical protein LWI29_003889 [Acer saccharum]|uniref:SAM-dependent MTase RsmB/NOP-type domain-containing protein n=1 Tax=Acer saccharum TaxID=4024 RepID=A0AA39T0S4_ACESA|nr:hypothetical protein LWI29_003889 [Acer saccharum]
MIKIYGIDTASGAAVSALDGSVGDHVLDLCAAPGFCNWCPSTSYLDSYKRDGRKENLKGSTASNSTNTSIEVN